MPPAAIYRKSTVNLGTTLLLSPALLRRASDSTLLLETMKVIMLHAYHHLNKIITTKIITCTELLYQKLRNAAHFKPPQTRAVSAHLFVLKLGVPRCH